MVQANIPVQPLVSVCVQTYQHGPYIRDALEGILMQKTDFPVEILIGEDGSTDGTREICMEYAKRYPDKIRLFLNTRETVIYVKGRPTGRWNFINNVKNARGKYIALLPGDDYWTDPLKLQKQFDVLERNDHLVACHHWYTTRYENGIQDAGTPRQGYSAKTITSLRDIFANRVRIKARAIMFRNVIHENFFPDWFLKVKYGDVPLSFLLGKYGDFYFIDEPMAVYRITGKGLSLTGSEKMVIPAEIIEHYVNWIEIWRYADRHYQHRYRLQANMTILSFYGVMVARIVKNFWKFSVLSLKSVRP